MKETTTYSMYVCTRYVFRAELNRESLTGPLFPIGKKNSFTVLYMIFFCYGSSNGYVYVCMVITYSRVWINRVRLPILLVVS